MVNRFPIQDETGIKAGLLSKRKKRWASYNLKNRGEHCDEVESAMSKAEW